MSKLNRTVVTCDRPGCHWQVVADSPGYAEGLLGDHLLTHDRRPPLQGERVAVALPLSLDTVSRLLRLIAAEWPGADLGEPEPGRAEIVFVLPPHGHAD